MFGQPDVGYTMRMRQDMQHAKGIKRNMQALAGRAAASGTAAQEAKNQYHINRYGHGGFRRALDSQILGMLNGVNGQQGAGAGPNITEQGVYSPHQVQQQVNSALAANDQSTAGDLQGIQRSLSGQGYGANSPLTQALMSQRQAAGAATNAATRTNLPLQAAQMNARQLLNTQAAREQQFGNRRREAISMLGQVLGLVDG